MLGPNGSGKTTLLRIISGILLPDEGEVLVGGHRISKKIKKEILFIGEKVSLYPKLTVLENVEFWTSLSHKRYDAKEAADILERIDLPKEKWNMPAEVLSRGMAQKALLATAFLVRPKIILIDDVFAGLDPKSVKSVKNMLRELRDEGSLILITTHRVRDAEDVADRVIIMNSGEIAFIGTVSSAKSLIKEGYPVKLILDGPPEDMFRDLNASIKVTERGYEVRLLAESPAQISKLLEEVSSSGLRLVSMEVLEPSVEALLG